MKKKIMEFTSLALLFYTQVLASEESEEKQVEEKVTDDESFGSTFRTCVRDVFKNGTTIYTNDLFNLVEGFDRSTSFTSSTIQDEQEYLALDAKSEALGEQNCYRLKQKERFTQCGKCNVFYSKYSIPIGSTDAEDIVVDIWPVPSRARLELKKCLAKSCDKDGSFSFISATKFTLFIDQNSASYKMDLWEYAHSIEQATQSKYGCSNKAPMFSSVSLGDTTFTNRKGQRMDEVMLQEVLELLKCPETKKLLLKGFHKGIFRKRLKVEPVKSQISTKANLLSREFENLLKLIATGLIFERQGLNSSFKDKDARRALVIPAKSNDIEKVIEKLVKGELSNEF